jgi:hypothetical protein
MVFTDQSGVDDTRFMESSTSPVYFLQLMMRCGLIWSGIAPGMTTSRAASSRTTCSAS